MPSDQPTHTQAIVLKAIRRRLENGESAPSYRDLCREFGWSSTGTVRDHLRALARKGHVKLSGPGHRQVRLRGESLAVPRVPIVGRVAAGSPVLAEENIEGHLPVPAEWIGAGIHFALRVHGDSMIDAGIREGDYVVVRQQDTAEDGEIVVATLDTETTLKRLDRHGKHAVLRPENTRYRAIQVRADTSVVQGVVVGLMRAYRKGGLPRWFRQNLSSAPVIRDRRRRAHRA